MSIVDNRCGWSYSGVCNAFWEGDDVYSQLIKNLERVNFTENGVKFAFTNRQYLEGYSIYQYKDSSQPRKVGASPQTLSVLMLNIHADCRVESI